MTGKRSIAILNACDPDDVAAVKTLFIEYAKFLGEDLCFQGFSEEMATFPAFYARLLLARVDGAAAGGVGLKDLGDGVCEMKRLFVRPDFQGLGLGRGLSEALIEAAREKRFRIMRLDTLSRLNPALALYETLGFERTRSYYDNPLPGVVYMAKEL